MSEEMCGCYGEMRADPSRRDKTITAGLSADNFLMANRCPECGYVVYSQSNQHSRNDLPKEFEDISNFEEWLTSEKDSDIARKMVEQLTPDNDP